MASDYKNPISIKEAIDAIDNRDYLLPAIQRKFVWSRHQVCALFDSIMQGYPINTFMMWEITDGDIKNEHKFYEFLKFYCERFYEENPHQNTSASFKNFKAIIDGQQRLTALYIGLCGTYAEKNPRVQWPSVQDDEKLPPRKLYLDLKQHLNDEDSLMKYNFQFLTEKQYKDSLKEPEEKKCHWFCLHEILEFKSTEDDPSTVYYEIVNPFLKSIGLSENKFAQRTLSKLYNVIRNQKIIHYFNETSQEMDHVLDVFIRTNSGGTKLIVADMLMSIVVANWDGDFRQEIDNLTEHILQSTAMGFHIERDWVLKTCLMLTDADVRFKVKNFKVEQVKKIQLEWEDIEKCIKATWFLIRRLGINEQSLTSQNAVIPICYYLYKRKENTQPLYHDINDLAKFHDQRTKISLWFYMTLLKGVFGGQSDTILDSMRKVLKDNIQKPLFPLENIIERYKTTSKDLRFDDDYIESLLDIQHEGRHCRALLHLLFPEMNPTEVFHIDHLHPKSAFEKKNLQSRDFLKTNPELMEFFSDKRHWNSIANLHLLNDSQNMNKHDKPLIDWTKDPKVKLNAKDLLAEGVDLKFQNFQQFYEKRRANLKEKLKKRVTTMSSEEVVEDS